MHELEEHVESMIAVVIVEGMISAPSPFAPGVLRSAILSSVEASSSVPIFDGVAHGSIQYDDARDLDFTVAGVPRPVLPTAD